MAMVLFNLVGEGIVFNRDFMPPGPEDRPVLVDCVEAKSLTETLKFVTEYYEMVDNGILFFAADPVEDGVLISVVW